MRGAHASPRGIANLLPILFLVLACAGPLHSEGVLLTKPLEPLPQEATLLHHMERYFKRQYEEKFTLAEKLDPKHWFSVDLKPSCNMNLFSAEGKTCPVSFPCMPLGRQVFYGVPFQVIAPAENQNRTVLALPSQRLLSNELRPSVDVPVGKKASVLYFLVASYYSVREGEQYFRLNYEDGSSHTWPIIATEDTGDWYHESTRICTENTRYVLIPQTPNSKTAFRNMHVIQRQNPNPDKVIKSITFKTDVAAPMAILVVAVTGHPGE